MTDQSGRRLVLALLAVCIVVLALKFTPAGIALTGVTPEKVGQLLSALFIIALFMERSLEVFINLWRQPEATGLDQIVSEATQSVSDIEAVDQAAVPTKVAELVAAKQKLSEVTKTLATYRSGTQTIALWTSFIAGLVVSAVGPRTLESFVTTESIKQASEVLQASFHAVDILLTGGLLAGGSEGLHKLTQVYTNYMEATAEKAKVKP